MAACLGNLAELRLVQGRIEEAEPIARRCLGMRERSLGTNHPDVAETLRLVAAILRASGRDTEAEPLEARAGAILETTDAEPAAGETG